MPLPPRIPNHAPLLIATLAALSTLLVASLARADVPEAPGALTAAERVIFWGSAEDPEPRKLDGVTAQAEGKHYITSNEWNLQLFYPHIRNLGGGYMGVGTDQAYLFIGWQRPAFAWLTDYDPVVKDVHRIYHAFFLAAATPEDFLAYWEPDRVEEGQALLEALPLEPRHKRRVQRLYRTYQKQIAERLHTVRTGMLDAKVPSYLTDVETYRYVRDLVQARRVRPMLVNLLADRGVKAVGEAAQSLGVPLRGIYLSNAEQYWSYGTRFRRNMRSLYWDDGSLLLRTLLTWGRNRDYRYAVQPMDNFAAWLGKKWVRSIRSMIPARKDEQTGVEFFVFRVDVADAERTRRRRGWSP